MDMKKILNREARRLSNAIEHRQRTLVVYQREITELQKELDEVMGKLADAWDESDGVQG